MAEAKDKQHKLEILQKTPTGIRGLDEITNGGLPSGRTSLVCGSAGSGKTMMAMEFLVHGAQEFNEPGVFVAFEETEQDLVTNVASLGFDLKKLIAQKKILLDYVRVERSEIEETGEYDLEGLFIRIDHAVKTVGAKRVVLDTLDGLFASLPNENILRAELRRLFRWLKERKLTTLITGERGAGALTRHGMEEYVADCVILLDHRVDDQVSTRRLRIVKYRGTTHGTNEYPFLIGGHGFHVLPITSLTLSHKASTQRISSGVPQLDEMLGGSGYYRGSSILVSGTAGTGKSSLAAAFVNAACSRGERALYFAFEESPDQIVRNMRTIGYDLEQWMKKGLLEIRSQRATQAGLEFHLLEMHRAVQEFGARAVVIDPISNLISTGSTTEVKGMLTRLIDFLKSEEITAMFTCLTFGDGAIEGTDIGISSLMDTWILLRSIEHNGERNRALYILKSRATAHSNQVREFVLSANGIELVDVYTGGGTVLTGTARVAQAAREQAERVLREQALERRRRELDREREAVDAQIKSLQAGIEARADELAHQVRESALLDATANMDRQRLQTIRSGGRNGEARKAKSKSPR
jgi:circadian clock protein KaiC